MPVDRTALDELANRAIAQIERQVGPDARVGEVAMVMEIIRGDGTKGLRAVHTGAQFSAVGLLELGKELAAAPGPIIAYGEDGDELPPSESIASAE